MYEDVINRIVSQGYENQHYHSGTLIWDSMLGDDGLSIDKINYSKINNTHLVPNMISVNINSKFIIKTTKTSMHKFDFDIDFEMLFDIANHLISLDRTLQIDPHFEGECMHPKCDTYVFSKKQIDDFIKKIPYILRTCFGYIWLFSRDRYNVDFSGLYSGVIFIKYSSLRKVFKKKNGLMINEFTGEKFLNFYCDKHQLRGVGAVYADLIDQKL